MERRAYSTDLSDAEWTCLAPHVPAPKPGGRPPKHSRRELLNAIFYLIRSGCAWRLLPNDLPPWRTVYHYWRVWRLDGTWERIHTALRQRPPVRIGRHAHPRAAILHHHSGQTTRGGRERRARLRRGQEAEWAQAPPPGRYSGPGARGQGPPGGPPGSGRRLAGVGAH